LLQDVDVLYVLESDTGIQTREACRQQRSVFHFNYCHVLPLPCTDTKDIGTSSTDRVVAPVVENVARILKHRAVVTRQRTQRHANAQRLLVAVTFSTPVNSPFEAVGACSNLVDH